MGNHTKLWFISHAPVDGPRGIVHSPDAPAELSDAAAFTALKAKLPTNAFAVCSPARRTLETALALGPDPLTQACFGEQDFGAWTGTRHDDLAAELVEADRECWQSRAGNGPPVGDRFVNQVG